jgi:phosphoglycerol transferase MdoB-like AlkP superfamily enzyme
MFSHKKQSGCFWIQAFYTVVFTLYTGFYFLDLGFYDYLKNRIDASAVTFLKNPLISMQMVTESYPVFSGILLSILIGLLFFLILKFIVFNKRIFVSGERILYTPFKIKIALFLLIAALAHGKISQYPLRWSEAFFSTNSFVSAMALNPLLYFYDTFAFKEKNFDIDAVKKHYEIVSAYLGVESPDAENLNYTRQIRAVYGAFDSPPNVVVIMMESLASFKLSHFGQKIDATPNMDELIPKSLFFENAYVTSTGTARSIFGMLTGLPDVNSRETASRNPLLVSQYSAANAFEDYNKSYFIGGSASWGNIRGFVSQSLKDVTIFEEKDFSAGKNDVWGISDLKLFDEAHKYLKAQPENQKQFTFIQTAGYHRPYTIPKDRGGYKVTELTEQEIKENGFVNNDEFNSLKFSDYALGEFFKQAEKEDYFKNTLFVIYADHGLAHFASKDVSAGQKRFRLPIMHIPLIFYSPSLKITPKVFKKVAYQPDFMPSVAALAGKSYENKTLGRSLFDPKYDTERFALTISNFSPPVSLRLHDEQYVSEGNVEKGLRGLYPYTSEDYAKDLSSESEEYKQNAEYRDKLARGLYETTKYLYYNSNK